MVEILPLYGRYLDELGISITELQHKTDYILVHGFYENILLAINTGCKKKEFHSCLNKDDQIVYLNSTPEFVSKLKLDLSFDTPYGLCLSDTYAYMDIGSIKLNNIKLFTLTIFPFENTFKTFKDSFEFEKLNLPKEFNDEIYFHIIKSLHYLSSILSETCMPKDRYEKIISRCMDNLSDDLKLVLEIKNDI